MIHHTLRGTKPGDPFGDLPFKPGGKHVQAISDRPLEDARECLTSFMQQAYRRPVTKSEFQRFYGYAKQLLAEGTGFTDTMITTYSAVLASPYNH